MADPVGSSGEQEKAGWFTHLLQRLRSGRRSDTIVANVGAGSQSVVVGKNIIQIGRLSIPLWVIALLALLLLATFALTVLPYLRSLPVQTMNGDFNVVIADFGVQQADQQIVASQQGAAISAWLARRLDRELTRNEEGAALQNSLQESVVVWQESVNKPSSNPAIGLVRSEADAAQVVNELGATLVIYGYLSQERETPKLTLNFYYNSPQVQGEPDAAMGRHQLGQPIPIRYSNDLTLMTGKLNGDPLLALRTEALVWLTRGLIQDITGAPQNALAILQDARNRLSRWEDKPGSGKEVLYYFIGRVALALKEFDLAEESFRQAIALNDQYINAHLGLGSVFLDRAQWYFIGNRSTQEEVAMCITQTVPAAPQALLQSKEEAWAASEQALDEYRYAQALATASSDRWPLLRSLADTMLARGYRLQADILVEAGNSSQADPTGADSQLVTATTLLTQAIQLLDASIQPFQQAGRIGWVAHAYLDKGSAQRTAGTIAQRQGNIDAARQVFSQAADDFATCGELEERKDDDGSIQLQQMVGCFCKAYEKEVRQTLTTLGGGAG